MQLRQPVEGDKIVSLQGVNESCHKAGGSYIPNTLSVIINGTEYVLSSIIGLAFGFASFNSPVPLKAGDTIRVKSNCMLDETNTFTVLSTNFTITAEDATICNNSSNITVTYNDILRVYLLNINSEFELYLNNQPLSLVDFNYQQYQTTTFSSDGLGGFKGTVNTNNSAAFSKVTYDPSNGNTVKIIPKGGYFTVRFGFIELIFSTTDLGINNFAIGVFEDPLNVEFELGDVFELISDNESYTVILNGDTEEPVYTFSKELVVTPTAGTIETDPAILNTPIEWTLPVSVGSQTVTASFGSSGVYTSTVINVDYCRAEADDKTINVDLGSTNNPIPEPTGTVPTNCTGGGIKITQLPSCALLLYSGDPVEVNDIIPEEDYDKLTLDIPSECSSTDSFKYQLVATGSGCLDSLEATVTINIAQCPPDWVNSGEPECVDCAYVQKQENLNYECSGGSQFRYISAGDNSNCTQPVWEDTGQTRCEDCQNEKEQQNTNPCYTGTQTRWVEDSEGTVCDDTPNWVDETTICTGTTSGLKFELLKTGETMTAGSIHIELFENTISRIDIYPVTKDAYDINDILDQLAVQAGDPKGYIHITLDSISAEVPIAEVDFIGGVYRLTPVENANVLWSVTNTDITYSTIYLLVKYSGETTYCKQLKVQKDTNICSSTYYTYKTTLEEGDCSNDDTAVWITYGVPFCSDCSEVEGPCQDCVALISEKDISVCSATFNDTRATPWNGKFEWVFITATGCSPIIASAGKLVFQKDDIAAIPGEPHVPCGLRYLKFPTHDIRNINLKEQLDFLYGESGTTKATKIIVEVIGDPSKNFIYEGRLTYLWEDSELVVDLGGFFVNSAKYYNEQGFLGVYDTGATVKVTWEYQEELPTPCPVTPILEDLDSEVRCNNCQEQRRVVDTARCSAGYGIPRWIPNPGGTACDTLPNWEDVEYTCIDCVNKTIQKDTNPCSPTYGEVRTIDTVSSENYRCGGEPEFQETDLTRPGLDGQIYVYWVNVNGCNSTPGEWRVLTRPSIEIEDGCIPKTDPCKTTINIFKKCPKLPCGCNSTSTTTVTTSSMPKFEAKWGKVNTKNVIASNITNAEFSGDFIKGSNIIVDFPYITPEYLFLAEPATEDQKVRWYENPLNNEDIGANLVWELFGIVSGYRVYITSFKTFFSSPITFTKD